jgi:hypothetical protein
MVYYYLSQLSLNGCIIPWVGSLMEEKSCLFNEISGMAIWVSIVCLKRNIVTFYC